MIPPLHADGRQVQLFFLVVCIPFTKLSLAVNISLGEDCFCCGFCVRFLSSSDLVLGGTCLVRNISEV